MKRRFVSILFNKDLVSLFDMLRSCGIKSKLFLIPIIFSLFAAVLEGLSLSLLAPALDIAVQGALEAKRQSWMVRQLQAIMEISGIYDKTTLLGLLVLVVFFSELLKYILTYLSAVKVSKLVHQFSHSIRVKLFSRYLAFGKLYFDSNSRGEMYQILTTNTRIVALSLRTLNLSIFHFSTLFVYVVMMFMISWQLTLVTLLVFPALHYLAENEITRIRKSSIKMSNSNTLLGRRISNALASIPLVKMHGTEAKERDAFIENSKSIESSENEIDRAVLLLEPIRDIVVLFCIAMLVGFIWIVSTLTNAAGVGKYLVFILLLKRAARFFGSLNSTRANFAEIFGPLSQILALFDEKIERYEVSSGSRNFDKLKSVVEIRELSFNYPGKEASLNSITLSLIPGKTLAIVGRSGSGKSTLVNVLARFYECPENTIFVNGEDIRSYSLHSWSKQIALVSQDSFLFYASLRDNLNYGVESVTDLDLNVALERASMLDFVSSLPEGLDTIVGDGGVKLSGGEKQRISLARAFLKDPEIIILDEPTSALDSQTEIEIQKEINSLCYGKTVIIIAHRLATVKNADSIVVLEAGRIVQQGTLAQLTSSEGEFRKYWDAQQLPL